MSVSNPTKNEIVVNGNILIDIDNISFEYSQQDSEASGNSEDGTMYRDVIGLKNKIYCRFDKFSSHLRYPPISLSRY